MHSQKFLVLFVTSFELLMTLMPKSKYLQNENTKWGVVPGKYNDFTAKWQTTKILDVELSKRKELFVSLELFHKEERNYRMFPVHQYHIFITYLVLFLSNIDFLCKIDCYCYFSNEYPS